jgi:1,4-dihydroxy-2-naphthoate octaprenyltransferase
VGLNQAYGSLLSLIILPWMVLIGRGIQQAATAAETDPYLKQMAISTLGWTILFGIGLIL